MTERNVFRRYRGRIGPLLGFKRDRGPVPKVEHERRTDPSDPGRLHPGPVAEAPAEKKPD